MFISSWSYSSNMGNANRRQFIKTAGAGLSIAGINALAGCIGDLGSGQSGGGGDDGEDLYTINKMLGEGGLFIVPFQLGIEENTWEPYGIDLNIEITSFAEYSRGFETGGLEVGTGDQSMFIDGHLKDIDLVALRSNLLTINDIFVRPDSDIESPADLEGKRVGVPFWESATTMSMRAFIRDEWGISLREDTEGVASDAASLWGLLVEQNELDAMVQFTGFTIKGYANPDQVRPIFDISNEWRERTGHPLSVTFFLATQEWYNNNQDIAYNLIRGYGDAIDALGEDPLDAYSRLGLLAGIETDEEAEVAAERQYEFLELFEKHDLWEAVPPKDKFISFSDLEANAG